MVLYAGRRVPLDRELRMGRSEDNDLVLTDNRASRRHALIRREGAGFILIDLGSRHGTFLNGELLRDEGRGLEAGDSIEVGGAVLRFVDGRETRIASRELPVVDVQTVAFEGDLLSIGRDPRNDVVLADPNVSRFHATVARQGDGIELADLGSRNGTRLDGNVIDRARLEAGSDVGIGPYRLIFDGNAFVASDDHGALRLDAIEVSVRLNGTQLLAPASLSIAPGEMVAIIGESGAGKSTLLKVLGGVTSPSEGTVTLNGEDLAARLTDVGYVPQDDIVHRLLTVREALVYAARLRLPQDVSGEEIEAAVNRVLGELSLEEQADTRIGSLSGGQRKRTSVATELLSRPSVLFLDEPTTGMDPGLETQMMRLFRELSRGGRAIALVTHATKNLSLCDRVVIMGRGGVLTYVGPPDDGLRFFGVDDYDGIYAALPTREPAEWMRMHETKAELPPERPARPKTAQRRRRSRFLPQLGVLMSRYMKLFARDRRNAALLLGQAPVLALFGAVLFQAGLFDQPGGSPGGAVNFLFLMAITVIWLGAIDAAPELVKERSVMEREAAIGTRLSAYLASKLVVLFGLAAIQTLLYSGVLLALRPLDASGATYAVVIGLLIATSLTAVCMGLLVSAAVNTQDQAMSLIPLAVIPQLLFAGAIVPVAGMTGIARPLADLIFGQWALAGLGTAVDMNSRFAADPAFAKVNPFGSDFFDLSAGATLAVLGAFLVVFLTGTALLVRRQLKT